MSNVLEMISGRVTAAIEKAFGDEAAGADPQVTPATDAKFGHYQCNAAMGLARVLRRKPRDIAADIIEALDADDLFDAPEIAGPGFINLRMKPEFITAQLRERLADERLGVAPCADPRRVIIDYPSPNLAKEMHVGHLRVAIIGECVARVHDFLGHTTLRRDHVGDWGTQFGMLIAHLRDACPEALTGETSVDLGDINAFYKQAKARFDAEPEFKKQSQLEVVKFQSGDTESERGRQALCDHSRGHCQEIYDRLGVVSEEYAESFYKDHIPATLEELDRLGMVVESEGAQCVFPDGFTNKDGDPLPLIVRKSDGAFNYDTTDMAAIRYRVQEERVGKIVYVTDLGQSQHFQMVFTAARQAGWLDDVETQHIGFGLVLGENKRKFATRSGESPRLKDLLDEAEARSRAIVDEKNTDLDEATRAEVARAIGIGAIKYADLSQNRNSDYVFSFEKMLALQGNTAPYLIYAYVRVQSIARKGGVDFSVLDVAAVETLATPEEIDLGRLLLRLPEILDAVERELLPNRLTDYLFDLSQTFSRFYTNNKVLGDKRETTRLALCDLTARALKLGLHLLGIDVTEKM